MTNIIFAMCCKDKSRKVISQSEALICFTNLKKDLKKFKRDLIEVRSLEEVMMWKSFEKIKNATQTVKKLVVAGFFNEGNPVMVIH